jgi:hypothetical protein
MGTWNTGNFDCDGARDYLHDAFQKPLVERIESIMGDAVAVQLDEQGEDVLMPSIELLALLCEIYGCDGGTLPEVATVRRWREEYLGGYDSYIDQLSPRPGYKEERRRVIEQTFARLERAVIQHHDA